MATAGPDAPASIERGFWLSGYLTVASIIEVQVVALSLSAWHRLVVDYPPRWFAACVLAVVVLRALSTAGLWYWSRSAVVLNALVSLTAIGLLIGRGLPPATWIGFAATLILLVLIYPYWRHMPWGLASGPLARRT